MSFPPCFRPVVLIVLVTVFSKAPVQAAEMQYPLDVAAGETPAVFVADRNLPGIWKHEDGETQAFFKGSKQFGTPLNAVRCLELDHKGRPLAGDSASRQVYRFDEAGQPQTLATNETGIGIPMDVAVDSEGNLFVADLEVKRIWKLPPEGGKPRQFAQVPAPRGLAIDNQNRLWVVSHGKNQLLRISPEGEIEAVVKGRPFRFPHQVVLTEKNEEITGYVSDGYAQAIWKVTSAGEPEKWVSGKPLQNPVGLAWRGETLFVADPHAKAIFAVNPKGELTTLIASDAQ